VRNLCILLSQSMTVKWNAAGMHVTRMTYHGFADVDAGDSGAGDGGENEGGLELARPRRKIVRVVSFASSLRANKGMALHTSTDGGRTY